MTDSNTRDCHGDAVDKIIGNMTPPQANDGRYVPLGFATQKTVSDQLGNVSDCLGNISDPLATVADHLCGISDHVNISSDRMNNRVSEHLNCSVDGLNNRRTISDHIGNISGSDQINWMQQGNSYNMGYGSQFMDSSHLRQEGFQQNMGGYMLQSPSMFDPAAKFQKNINLNEYSSYKSSSLPQSLYNNHEFLPQNVQHTLHEPVLPDSTPQSTNHTQLIENLVGNWVVPNTTGTYTPFGSSEAFKPSVFDFQNHRDYFEQTEDIKFQKQELKDDKFNFNRANQKPRMVAEVKPMRPSYSDVLTKPVIGPSTSNIKNVKTEIKDSKIKGKENKKGAKVDKNQKTANILSRSSTNNDLKDVSNNERLFIKTTEKKVMKINQLNRKWNSLDNISEPANIKNDDLKKKKVEDNTPKLGNKQFKNKLNKTFSNILDDDQELANTETYNITKTTIKKSGKTVLKQKLNENQNGTDRPNAKRMQRGRKKDNHIAFGIVGQKMKHYTKGWWKVISAFILWLMNVISDICSISIHLGRDLAIHTWFWLTINWFLLVATMESILKKWRYSAWIWEKVKGRTRTKEEELSESFLPKGLETNINMPTTGDEAMKRLLACKGKDPYSILGVTPTCTDDDIKKYYKRQAFLVHPDKNNQPGAEEAFKILVHAFDMIGIPERREAYDRGVAESAFMVQNFTQMAELLQRLQQKMEMNANTIRCSSCGDRHKRIKVDRPCYAARNCTMCKIHHAAREGDIWAEAKVMGFLWHYYACMEGAIYDITDWAGCQKDTLKHLKPDSHHVQYRIALGKQNNQPRKNSNNSPRMDRPDLENLLSSLYGHAATGENGTQKRKNKNKK